MATHGWGTDRSVEEFLLEQGHRFGFCQAVKLLEMVHGDKMSVGTTPDPLQETLRFKSNVRLDFAPSEVDSVTKEPGRRQPKMLVSFMGLASGANAPLPASYIELILDRINKKDTAFRDFLDIFNHRLVSLMYRAYKKFHVGFDFKRPDQDRVSSMLFSLAGMNTPNLQGRMHAKDRALLLYTGILCQQPHSMAGLETILSHYFQVKVRGRPFCGKWYNLEEDQYTYIGASGQNQVLGEDAVLGKRVWDQQGKFRLYLGPLTLNQFLDILPVGHGYVPLCELTRFFAGQEFDFDLNLILKSGEVPRSRIGRENGPRLGWTSWLKTREFVEDDSQVRLTLRSGFYVTEHFKEI